MKLIQGKNCQINKNSFIGYSEHGDGIIWLGNNVKIRHNCLLRTCGGSIIIGNNVVVNYGCIIHALGGIVINDNVMLSPNVQLYAQNHGTNKDILMMKQIQIAKGIKIETDVWIGAGTIILDGVHIYKGAVTGAGSVITKNIPSYEIWAGNPAKKIGQRK